MNSRKWRSTVVAVLAFTLLNTGFMQTAQAGVFDTAVMVQSSRDGSIAVIQSQLAQAEVRAQLERFGVEPAAIEGRLAALSDRELAQMAERMQETPAGGDGLIVIIGLTFVVLLILELVGVIDIFKRA
jgi:hypothetical protein